MKEPALSDGRLQPGDKLLAANGVELASFSHQEVTILMVHLMMVMSIMIIEKRSWSCLPVPEILGMIDTRVNRSGEFDFYP